MTRPHAESPLSYLSRRQFLQRAGMVELAADLLRQLQFSSPVKR